MLVKIEREGEISTSIELAAELSNNFFLKSSAKPNPAFIFDSTENFLPSGSVFFVIEGRREAGIFSASTDLIPKKIVCGTTPKSCIAGEAEVKLDRLFSIVLEALEIRSVFNNPNLEKRDERLSSRS